MPSELETRVIRLERLVWDAARRLDQSRTRAGRALQLVGGGLGAADEDSTPGPAPITCDSSYWPSSFNLTSWGNTITLNQSGTVWSAYGFWTQATVLHTTCTPRTAMESYFELQCVAGVPTLYVATDAQICASVWYPTYRQFFSNSQVIPCVFSAFTDSPFSFSGTFVADPFTSYLYANPWDGQTVTGA